MINTSIVTGVFPSTWKHAWITPILKSGKPEDPSNYRPIALLPILSKILEKIVATQLMSYLESNNLLSSTQHGFRAGLSTTTALTKISNRIYENIDNKKVSLLTLCDLSKAFDSVCHKILIRKMYNTRIDSFWFEGYLSHRTQSVRIGGNESSTLEISYGCPRDQFSDQFYSLNV